MQTGMKAGLAIVLAVFLTGIVGFLTAVVPEDEERTYYDQVSDLTPIVDASAIDSYTEYNSITNVSGWADNEGVTIPFLEGEGISPYPYRHYVSSTAQDVFANTLFPTFVQNWGSIENAIWWPTASAFKIDQGQSIYGVNYVEDNGVKVTKAGYGNIIVERESDMGVSFSVYFAHMNGATIVHDFIYTYYYMDTYSDPYYDESITSWSQFDSTSSDTFNLGAGPNGRVRLTINIPGVQSFGGDQLYVSFITSDNWTGADYYILQTTGEIVEAHDETPVGDKFYNNMGMTMDDSYSGRSLGIENILYLDGVQVNTTTEAYTVMPLSKLLYGETLKDNTTIVINKGPAYFSNIYLDCLYVVQDLEGVTNGWDASLTSSRIESTNTLALTKIGQRMTYKADNQSWYPSILSENGRYYEANDAQGIAAYLSSEVFVVLKGYIPTITGQITYPVYEYMYMQGNKFVSIGDGVTGKWRNYMDSTVGGKTVVTNYQNGAVTLLTVPGTTITSQKAVWKDTDGVITEGTMSLIVPSSIPYSMALVTLDFQSGQYYAQGVVWGAIDEEDRNTDNWTLRPYQYPITPTFNKGGTVTAENPSYIEGLQFSKAGGTKAYIVSTEVMTDPMGRLWGDPTIYLGYYFPDYFTYDSTTGNTGVPTAAIRMLINGVVSYGDSLTINGQYMPVADGNITFTYYTYETETIPSTDPNIPPTTNTITVTNEGNMPIKGMAIDWEDGHVYLVFTEQGKTRYDLGEYNTTAANVVIAGTDTGKDTVAADIISGTGTWYWQSNLYTINHEIETVLHLDLTQGLSGWGMTLQVSMLLFAGMLIVGVAIVHYYYRDSDEPMGILDWVIIGAAILLSLGVATI